MKCDELNEINYIFDNVIGNYINWNCWVKSVDLL